MENKLENMGGKTKSFKDVNEHFFKLKMTFSSEKQQKMHKAKAMKLCIK